MTAAWRLLRTRRPAEGWRQRRHMAPGAASTDRFSESRSHRLGAAARLKMLCPTTRCVPERRCRGRWSAAPGPTATAASARSTRRCRTTAACADGSCAGSPGLAAGLVSHACVLLWMCTSRVPGSGAVPRAAPCACMSPPTQQESPPRRVPDSSRTAAPEVVRPVVGAGGGEQRLHPRLVSRQRRVRARQRGELAAAPQPLRRRQLGPARRRPERAPAVLL